MKKCPYCSAELEDNAAFCLYCMKNFDKKENIVPFKNAKKKYRLIIWIIAALIVLIAIIAIIGFAFSKNGFNRFNIFGAFVGENSSEDNKSSFYGDNISEENFISFPSVLDYLGSQEYFESTHDSTTDDVYKNNSSLFDDKLTSNQTSTSSHKPQNSSDKPQNSSDKPQNSSNKTQEGSSKTQEGSSKTQNTTSQKTSSKETNSNSSITTTTSKTVTSSKPVETQKWEIREVSGGVEITGILVYEDSKNYTIPSKINGKTVVGIGMYAFKYETIKSIVLPETLKYIDDSAFADVRELKSIVIPKSVTSIGTNAFMGCKYLSKVYIKSADIEFGNYVFSSMYQRDVDLTIYAPFKLVEYLKNSYMFDAEYVEWNG